MHGKQSESLHLMKNAKYLIALLIAAFGALFQSYASDPFAVGLVAFYQFANNANDSSGNANHGTVNNITFATDRFGVTGQAGSFAGNSSSNIKINTLNLNLQPDFTVSVWINYTAGAGTEGPRIISTAGYEITTDSTFVTARHINFNNTYSTSFANVSSSNGVPAGIWTHIVGVRAGNELRLYINGNPAGSTAISQPPDYSRGFIPEIGGNSGNSSDNFAGLIDDLRIYSRALSGTEVAQLYAIESGPKVNFVKAFTIDYSALTIGSNYILQASADLTTWTNFGSAFTATSNSYTNSSYSRIDDWNKLFFRLQISP